jgi:preprotein translocase subunit YajC
LAVSDDEVKEKIKERLEDVVEKGLDQVKGLMDQEKQNTIYGWSGTVESIKDEMLQIKTSLDLKEAKIATNADILKVNSGKGKKEIEPEDIVPDQFVITMGPKEEENLILAKRIIVLDEAPEPAAKRELISGKVKEIDGTEVLIQKNGDEVTLEIDKEVDLIISGIKGPNTDDIQVDDYLTAIVVLDKTGQVDSVKSVLVIPGATNPQAEENEVTEEEIESATQAAEEEEETEE